MKKDLIITLTLLLTVCSNERLTGTTDETNSGICGKVTYSNGAPVAEASLKIFRDSAVVPLGQSYTASDGAFLFDSLAPGTYGIWAEDGDSMAAYAASIIVPLKEQVTRNLTLDLNSSLTAFVRLQGGGNPNTVSVQTLGTDKTALADSTGRFTIKKLAKGDYTLRVSTSVQGYSTIYKPITIAGGVSDTLKDTIVFTLRNPFPTNEWLNAITYGNGRFVAVGGNGMIITSTDGSDWSAASSGGRNLNAVTWGNNLFVAVGDSCGTMTSIDGIHWTPYTLLPVEPCLMSVLSSVTYGNNQFVTAGWVYEKIPGSSDYYSILFTSADGITWKEQPLDRRIPIAAMAYGNSTFVGVGASRALVSSDGTNWAPYVVDMEIEPDTTFYSPSPLLGTVIWGGNQFVALGLIGSVYTSPDGITWTKRDARIDADPVGAVWQDNHYTIIGNKESDWPDVDTVKIVTSSDGVSWTSFFGWTAPSFSAAVTALSYGAGLYIVVGQNGLVTSSSDGITWNNRSSITTQGLNDVCWNAGQFVAVGRSGTIITSMNGNQWQLHQSGTTSDLLAIACDNNCYVAVGNDGTVCASENGADWTPVASTTTNYFSDIAWGNGRFVAVGDKKIIISSVDGKKWDIAMPSVDTMSAYVDPKVAYGKYGFVAVNNFREMFTSADGLSWKMVNAARDVDYTGVAWGADKYVVIGKNYDNRRLPYGEFCFFTSADGQVWIGPQFIPQAPYASSWNISWGANQFVVLDGNSPASSVYSADGLTWSLLPDPSDFQGFNAFAWDGNQYVFVGYMGAIATCPAF